MGEMRGREKGLQEDVIASELTSCPTKIVLSEMDGVFGSEILKWNNNMRPKRRRSDQHHDARNVTQSRCR